MKLDCTAVLDTVKAAESVINSIISDWEDDTENFYKMIDAWMPVAWTERKEDLLSPPFRGTLYEVLNGSYPRVGKAGLLLHMWRGHFKKVNHGGATILFSMEFMEKMQHKIAECMTGMREVNSRIYHDAPGKATEERSQFMVFKNRAKGIFAQPSI